MACLFAMIVYLISVRFMFHLFFDSNFLFMSQKGSEGLPKAPFSPNAFDQNSEISCIVQNILNIK